MNRTINIELTETAREKLERVAETFEGYSTEEVARILLTDAVREKYNALPAEEEPYTEEQREADEEAYFASLGLALVGEGENVELVDLAELS